MAAFELDGLEGNYKTPFCGSTKHKTTDWKPIYRYQSGQRTARSFQSDLLFMGEGKQLLDE